MKTFSRALLILFGAAAFAALAPYVPALISSSSVKYLAAVFGILIPLLSFFFSQLNTVTGVGVLSSREMERYTAKRAEIRKKFWTVIAICLSCSVVMWLVGGTRLSAHASVQGAVVGFLFSVGATYLLVVARWINDLSEFADRLRLIEQQRKEQEAALKRLADAAKAAS